MVIISFKDGADWAKANWVFRQLAEDVVSRCPTDAEIVKEMKQAQAIGALLLDQMDLQIRIRLIQAMKVIANDTLAGRIRGWPPVDKNDPDGHRIYVSAIGELLELLKTQDRRD